MGAVDKLALNHAASSVVRWWDPPWSGRGCSSIDPTVRTGHGEGQLHPCIGYPHYLRRFDLHAPKLDAKAAPCVATRCRQLFSRKYIRCVMVPQFGKIPGATARYNASKNECSIPQTASTLDLISGGKGDSVQPSARHSQDPTQHHSRNYFFTKKYRSQPREGKLIRCAKPQEATDG
jgi:hypothetical protein